MRLSTFGVRLMLEAKDCIFDITLKVGKEIEIRS